MDVESPFDPSLRIATCVSARPFIRPVGEKICREEVPFFIERQGAAPAPEQPSLRRGCYTPEALLATVPLIYYAYKYFNHHY